MGIFAVVQEYPCRSSFPTRTWTWGGSKSNSLVLSLLYDNVRVNCSGKMSVYEGRDIEPTRTGKTPSAQQRDGISTAQGSGGRNSGDQRTPGPANPGGLPEGWGCRTGPRQPGPQAPQLGPR